MHFFLSVFCNLETCRSDCAKLPFFVLFPGDLNVNSSSSKLSEGFHDRLMIPRSVLFHCIFLPVYEVKRLSQPLCWPLCLTGCSPSLSPDLRGSGTYCPISCIFYGLR
jgi:hypothetical protein